ncbi:MAG: DHH family phosphoesterase [Candidatus Acidifodinimicrobium sp.]
MDENIDLSSKKVEEFIRGNDDFTVLYHMDCDGVVSAVLLKREIESIGKRVKTFRASNYEDFETLDAFSLSNSVIICDMEVKPENLDVFHGKNLCVIDHHGIVGLEKEKNVLYINPKLWGDLKYTPCSLLEYRLFERHVSDLDWLAAVGLIADSGGKENADFVRSVAAKYSIELKDDEFLFQNDFGVAGDIINSLIILYRRKGAGIAVKTLSKAKSLKEILSNMELLKAYDKIRKESERLSRKFEREKVVSGIVEFFENSQSDKAFSSTLITALSHSKEHYGKIIVFLTDIGENKVRVNIRANGVEVRIPEILNKIFQEIEGEGGGHDKAAGATINQRDKERFKSEFSRVANQAVTQPS